VREYCASTFVLVSVHVQVELKINETIVEGANNDNYGYMSYLCNRIGFGESSKRTWMQLIAHFPDTPGFLDSSDPQLNRGFESRMDLTSNSREVTTVGALMLHSGESQKLLPPVSSVILFSLPQIVASP